jgi:hypothetical protein
VALAWFWVGPPAASHPVQPATQLLACALAAGAALTGATQQGALRAAAATIAAALFAALGVVLVGGLMAAERQVGSASPTVAHAFGAAVAGLAGSLAAAPLGARLAGVRARLPRIIGPAAIGVGVALLLVSELMGAASPVAR